MSSANYQTAYASLIPAEQAALTLAFATLDAQVTANIQNETALVAQDFLELLQAFASQLASGIAANDAWGTACRSFKFRGKALLPTQCPIILGKVKALSDHATHVHKASHGKLSPAAAEKLIRKHANQQNLPATGQFLRKAVMGDYVIWATFHANDSSKHPYPHLPQTHAGILAALGLGCSSSTEPIVFLAWQHQQAGNPPLHRPTIADAGNYSFFRPHADVHAWHGWTEPLPHSSAPSPQPELVLGKITCAGLTLPFHVIEA